MFKTLLLIATLCLLCAAPSHAHNSFVYVTNYGDGTVSQFRVKPNGTLTPLTPPAVRAHGLAHALAADPTGRFLYVTSARDWKRRDCVISQFRVAEDGRLTALSPAQVAVPGTPATIAVEPSGRFVYVFNREGTVAQFRIGPDGRLSPLSPQVVKAANAGGVTPIVGFDKAHHILYGSYVVGFGEVTIGGTFALAIGQDGQLRVLPGRQMFRNTSEQTVSPPYSLSLTPNGRYAYIPESLHAMHRAAQWRDVVAQYRTRPGGVLTLLSPKTIPVDMTGTSFIDPRGHFLYLVGVKTSELEATARYRLARARIRRDGTLGRFTYQTLNIQAPLPVSEGFYSLAFDTSGRFCCFADGNYVYLFRLHNDGSVSPLSPGSIHAGNGPLGIVYVQK